MLSTIRAEPIMEQKSGLCAFAALLILALFLWLLLDTFDKTHPYLPTRVQIYGESLFITLPKHTNRSGYSLAQSTSSGIAPFPSARVHQNGSIVNAVDLYLDTNGTLWVLDSGYVNTLRNPIKKGPPKVIALNADTGKILEEIDISSVVKGKAGYLNVDETVKGPKYLYISDGPSRSLAVWNIDTHKGHVVVLPKLVKKRTAFNVLYTALIHKRLYLTYFGSTEMYYIDTAGLLNNGKVVLVGLKDPRMVILGTKEYQIIFRIAGKPEIISWDTRQKLLEKNLKIIDKGSLEMNPMAVVQGYGRLWVLESNLHSYLNGSNTAHNFRLI